ncbi:hypothetical protein EV644_11594 [Kribbella orskensis]|uniref:Uncharacterized protein n=1 Tax=Kribbella orskensis TaxID=2512216 RepID=A0ABY2BDP3_9ACTN|nr:MULTISPECIES: hypothetical protein [Kribbella]TCN35531.1 hypothetical protein EV642_11694 [Kribbella sp. VKM Ac-2500]TCO17073.1 hypothetical protein EV644_11594 [Kribbella orskensis]
MKSGGSVWFVYGVAVLVTFVVGVVAFSVFVLAKVFGGSSPEEPGPVPVVEARQTAAPRVIRTTVAKVLEVRAVAANPEQIVLVVATPAGCAQKLQAAAYAEGPGAVAVRVTQRTYRTGCRWVQQPVLATAKAAIADRTLIVNGSPWTLSATDGTYQPALTPESGNDRRQAAGR